MQLLLIKTICKMKKFQDVYSETTTSETITIGSIDKPGKLSIVSTYIDSQESKRTAPTLYYDASKGELKVGDAQIGIPGSIKVGSAGSTNSVLIDGKNANITIGGYGNGDLILKDRKAASSIVIDAADSTICVGSSSFGGTIKVKNTKGENTIVLGGSTGTISIGNDTGISGTINIKNASGNDTIKLDGKNGDLKLGGVGSNGDITIKNSNDIETILIKGSSGDIEFLNADFAEEFEICEKEMDFVRPGTVMIIDDNSKLIPCNKSYDSKVVGVIAGAKGFKPGIVMDKNGGKNRMPVAIIGKVFCMVDADINPIETGDMLTTSPVCGHAMKVSDKSIAMGTVIGKALSGLKTGKGLIPVLVNLQ